MVNAGLIHTKSSALVTDSLMGPLEAAQIAESARSMGVKVRYVFNTHHHDDHTLGNYVFGAPCIASETDAATMRNWASSEQHKHNLKLWLERNPSAPEDTRIRCPEITFASEMSIWIDSLRVDFALYAGHTGGSSVCMIPEDGVMYAGDLLFIGRYPFVGDCDMARWCAALRRLICEAQQFDVVVPGHGPVLSGNDIGVKVGRLLQFFEETLGLASLLVHRGLTEAEALSYPEFPYLDTEQQDAAQRRQTCISKAFRQALEHGSRMR